MRKPTPKKTATISIRMTPAQLDRIQLDADENSRSRNAQIIVRLFEAIPARKETIRPAWERKEFGL